MKTTNEELRRALEVIADEDQLLTEAEFNALSDMTSEEMEDFTEKWRKVDCTRRQQVVCLLHDESDEKTSYDFSRIYRLCLRDHDPDVRYEAVKALWESRDTSLIPRLSKLMMEDESSDVREAAAEILGNFALMTELEDLPYSAELENALLSVYYNENELDSVRCQALIAVAPLSAPGVIKAIGDAQQKSDGIYNCAAVCAMGRNTDDVWIPYIIEALKSEDKEILLAAIDASGEIESPDFIPYLAALMIEKDEEVLYQAIVALGKIGTIAAKNAVMSQAEHESEKIREAVQDALTLISEKASPLSFAFDIKKHSIGG